MKILPYKIYAEIVRQYTARFHVKPWCVDRGGRSHPLGERLATHTLPVLIKARASALQESIRWGQPHVFFLAPGIVSWMVPLVNGETIYGGLVGGEVLPDDDPYNRSASINYLTDGGLARAKAEAYVRQRKVFDLAQAHDASEFLYKRVYELTGWKPALLERNREDAAQQRLIAEEIHRLKGGYSQGRPVDQERLLLSLIRVGDKNGVRRALSQLLAAMFLYSPRIAVVRAKAIEMMGYLVRAAVEDSPLLDYLLDRHHQWIMQIVEAEEFEDLCHVLRMALEDFIDSIMLQGYNRTNRHVQQALNHLAEHYDGKVTLIDVARATGLSPFRVAHLVKEVSGKSVMQHLRRLRIQKARELLEQTNQSCADIAYAVGYPDQSHFIRHFRVLTGTTPARYRRTRLTPPSQN